MCRVRHVRQPVVVRRPRPRLLRFLRAGDSLDTGGEAAGDVASIVAQRNEMPTHCVCSRRGSLSAEVMYGRRRMISPGSMVGSSRGLLSTSTPWRTNRSYGKTLHSTRPSLLRVGDDPGDENME
jgi:hypothetical protein